MTNLYPSRDRIETPPRLEVPTDEEILMELDLLLHSDRPTRSFGSAGNDWGDSQDD